MEPLRPQDPRQIGPYRAVARYDAATDRAPVPEIRFLARSPTGDNAVLVSLPPAGTGSTRFAAEAESARHLKGPWFTPVVETGCSDEFPWSAVAYVPALPLPAALAAYGGPLPERTVRAVGAALAEALVAAHSLGIAYAGLSPASVLLAADGPRLTCFGAVRTAAPDGTRRIGLPGLDPGSLPPEQAAGGRPRPLGDVFALGSVLAYAATGHTVPERGELPQTLRRTVSACLARDPASRPTASALLNELARAPRTDAPGPAPAITVMDGGASRASVLLTPGWLPGKVIAALALQSARLLATESARSAESAECTEAAASADLATPAGSFSPSRDFPSTAG